MKKAITLLSIIYLNTFAQPSQEAINLHNKEIRKIQIESCLAKYKTYTYTDCEKETDAMTPFLKEIQKILKNSNIKTKQKETMTISQEQAKIDITKAEIQKVFLKYVEQGNFKKDTNFTLKIEKE